MSSIEEIRESEFVLNEGGWALHEHSRPHPTPPLLLEIPETIHALVAGCYENLLGLCL